MYNSSSLFSQTQMNYLKGGNTMKRCAVLTLLLMLFFICDHPIFAKSTDDMNALKKEIEALKAGQKAIQKDIQDIKNQLRAKQRPPAPPEFKEAIIELGDNPSKGDENAKVTMVEFSDYQWPYCGRYVRETLPEIEKEYIGTGKIKYVLLDFPLPFHKNASKAAEAAHCAGEQGKYWEMHDKIFANQKAIGPKDLTEYAKAIGLDLPKFQECFDSGKYAEEVKKNIGEARKAGVRGAPSFFIGYTKTDKPKTVKVTKKLVGAQPYARFKEAIESFLSPKK